MEAHTGHVLTLANSIIGVSILAMPYCFKQCGILLAIIILLVSNLISRLACHFLIKSAIIARRRTFEYLAYYIFGALGKLSIEIGMIGFLLGTCIAFFVVMGDLGPELISEITAQEVTSGMRSTILIALGFFCVLPLGLLKNVNSLSGVSKATIGFYVCLVLKIITDALPYIFYGEWMYKVELWRPAGVIQCLPIFSMALSCQTQLFEIYQVVHNPNLEKMNYVIKNAVNICTLVYFFVGFFGYVAFADKSFTGNIMLSFSPSLLTNILKIGFILSIAFSFPLVIFPCRVSLHSLIYRQGVSIHENTNDYIPEGRFKLLTVLIVFVSLVIGILIPNIEFVLGLVGSSIGIMICVLFPVICFISISQKDTNERLLAKFILILGVVLMLLGTYENIHGIEKIQSPLVANLVEENRDINFNNPPAKMLENSVSLESDVKFNEPSNQKLNYSKNDVIVKATVSPEIRHEPPQPIEPQEPLLKPHDTQEKINLLEVKSAGKLSISDKEVPESEIIKAENQQNSPTKKEPDNLVEKQPNVIDSKNVNNNINKNDQVDIEAIKKDEKESIFQDKKSKDDHLEEHKILIDQLQKQNEVQEEIVKQQKKIIEAFENQQKQKANEEKLKAEIKAVKEIESIALLAIEKISGDPKENDKIVAELKNDVFKKVNVSVISKESKIVENTNDKKGGQPQQDIKIEDLKQMNNLLSAKIRQNNITKNVELAFKKSIEIQNPIEKLNEEKLIKSNEVFHNESAKKTNSYNNTGPLLINLGQNINNNIAKDSAKGMVLLPLLGSHLQQLQANISQVNNLQSTGNPNELPKNAVEDVKVMRRDILEFLSTRRR